MFKSLIIVFLLAANLSAEIVCLKSTLRPNGRIKMKRKVIASGSCGSRFVQVVDTSTLTGPQGPAGTNGTNGADGAIAVYGDGSQGAISLANGESVLQNGQYTNFTVQSGASVSARSGTVIRATGTCSIEGTVVVSTFAGGGSTSTTTGTTTRNVEVPAHPGQSISIASPGEWESSIGTGFGGYGGYGFGTGIAYDEARNILKPGTLGGGGGAGYISVNSASIGGSGGGTITLLCKEGITVSGTINVSGENMASLTASGSGGGGGGIVILATPENITISGVIIATGGTGADAGFNITNGVLAGGGGGGGGGLVHALYGGTFTNTGTAFVTGGTGGASDNSSIGIPVVGGGGGGGSYGNGGRGGQCADGTQSAGSNGSNGALITTNSDPTSLFL